MHSSAHIYLCIIDIYTAWHYTQQTITIHTYIHIQTHKRVVNKINCVANIR